MDKKSSKISKIQNSALLSTANSTDRFSSEKMINKEVVLEHVKETQNKLKQKAIPKNNMTEIMRLVEKVNKIIDND